MTLSNIVNPHARAPAVSYVETIEGRAPNAANYSHARPSVRWIVGCDLGQSSDPTAICAMEHRVTPLNRWNVTERESAPPLKAQQIEERFLVRHLARVPLGLSYPTIVQEIANVMARPPLQDADLIVDDTGVGKAVSDLIETAGLRPQRVSITAGDSSSHPMLNRYHVAKSILISTLDARLHTGELKFSAELQEAAAMREELKDFRRSVSAAGRFTFEARVGKHDDLVLATALALWWAVKPKAPTALTGTFHWG